MSGSSWSRNGNPLTERHQILLVVAGQHAAIGVPPQCRGLAFVSTGALHHSAHQNRPASHLGSGLHGLLGERVERGVDVGRVLRPEQEIRFRRWPSRTLVIRSMVSDRWLLVTERARPIASMPRPGMLPCTIPTRTLPAAVAAGST